MSEVTWIPGAVVGWRIIKDAPPVPVKAKEPDGKKRPARDEGAGLALRDGGESILFAHAMRKTNTSRKPLTPAFTPASSAAAPKEAPTTWVDIRLMGTGNAPKFKSRTKFLASSGVKLPLI